MKIAPAASSRSVMPVMAWLASVALILCACTGAQPLGSSSQTSTSASALSGEYSGQVDIGGGRKLFLQCAGAGEPTVLLESGIHDSSDTWVNSDVAASPVFTEISRSTHVCIYDRPGTVRYTSPPELTTRSTPVSGVRTLPAMVEDLHSLLSSAGIAGPYVFVGHSYGGMIVRAYAQKYPKDTAGLVFVDAFGPNIKELFGTQWDAYAATLNKPGTALDAEPGWESVNADEAVQTINGGDALPKVPAAVISKTEPFAVSPAVPAALTTTLERVWPQVQQALVGLEPATPQVFATGSDHYVQVRDPDLTSSMIIFVLERARAGWKG